jgi:Holliday junction DNA helicase RuvA
MRDKLKDWFGSDEAQVSLVTGGEARVPAANNVADAEGALIALGYKPQEASRMVAAVNDDCVASSEDLIRRALKSVVKG